MPIRSLPLSRPRRASSLLAALAVSATAASGVPVEFGNLDPTYTPQLAAFSPQRPFAAVGSNVVDVDSFVAGTSTAGSTRGFGSVLPAPAVGSRRRARAPS